MTNKEIEAIKQRAEAASEKKRTKEDLMLLAMLASGKPYFGNPIHLAKAKRLRDKILEGYTK